MKLRHQLSLLLVASVLVALFIGGTTRAQAFPHESPTALQDCASAGVTETPNRDLDLMFLIDQSLSLAQDDKLKSLKDALEAMVPIFNNESSSLRVALATFSREAEMVRSFASEPLTANDFRSFINDVSVERNLQGGTNYIAATQLVLEEFRRNSDPERCKVVVWFTDGEADIPGEQNRVVEATTVLADFCGQDSSTSSKADLFRGLGVRPFVVLLTKQSFDTKEPPFPKTGQTSEGAEPYRQWASVVSLRGLTGDWDELEGSVTKPGSVCDGYSDSWGEFLKVTDAEELAGRIIRILIRVIQQPPPDWCPGRDHKLLGLPAGVFIETIFLQVEGSGSGLSSGLILNPKKLEQYVTGNLLVLNRSNSEHAAILDSLPAGWDLELDSSVKSICFGPTFRSPEALEFSGKPSQSTVRVPRREGDPGLTVEVEFGEFTEAIDIDRLRWSDSSVEMNGATASVSPSAASSKVEMLPGYLRITPSRLGPAGKVIVDDRPLLGTVRVSPAVAVAGLEELPRLECEQRDEDGQNLLSIVSIGNEVSKNPYSSEGTCSLIGGEKSVGGGVIISMSDPSISSKDGGGFGLKLVGSDDPPVGELTIEVDNLTSGQAIEFFVGQDEPFPNRQLDLSRSTDLSVVWSDSDESVQLGEIRLLVNVSLIGRSDKALALIIAIAASVLSTLLAYIALFFAIRRSSRVGRASELVYLSTEIVAVREIGGTGSSVQWIDRDNLSLPAFGVTKVKVLDDVGRKVLADRIRLEAKTAKIFHPLDVVRGPWTSVESTDTNSLGLGLSVEGRKPGSALSPLGPVVVADVMSRDVEVGRFLVRLTFIVPTQGPIAAFSGIQKLAQSTAISAISKAVQASVSASSTGKRADSLSEREPSGDQSPSDESSARSAQRDPRIKSEPPKPPSDPRTSKPISRDGETRNSRPPGASPR